MIWAIFIETTGGLTGGMVAGLAPKRAFRVKAGGLAGGMVAGLASKWRVQAVFIQKCGFS